LAEHHEPTRWRVDAHDVIDRVGGGWDSFAAENGAPGLMGRSVLGRSLHDFVAGDENRRIHRQLLRAVRARRAPIALPFRCDSPDLRRHMRLEMRPAGDDAVEFQAILLRVEPRAHLRLLDASQPRSHRLVVCCSFCHRIRAEEHGGWLEIDTAAERMGLLETERPPALAHGVCPSCKERLLRLRDRPAGEPAE
jgi:hypothetical protein